MTCKGCMGNVETQEHCLSVCTENKQEMRKRHNATVERLVKAVPQTLETKFLDQTVLGCDSLGRPDVVIVDDKDKKAYLVDVTFLCETPKNLKASRASKVDKYTGIKAKLEEKGNETVLDALLVGSLGTWDRENDILLRKLSISRKYQTLFKNCVAVTLLPVHTLSGLTGAIDNSVTRHKGAPKILNQICLLSTLSRLALSWQVSKTNPPVCWLVRPPSARVSLPGSPGGSGYL